MLLVNCSFCYNSLSQVYHDLSVKAKKPNISDKICDKVATR